MANKRMFTMKIVDSDAFLDMPLSAQCLYFHLNMRADDDGFVSNPRKVMRIIGANENDLTILFAKRFILGFEDGVIVIKHWRMHNTISQNRYHETAFKEEKSSLLLKSNGSYSFDEGVAIDDTKLLETQVADKRLTSGLQVADPDLDLDLGIDKDLKEKEKKKKSRFAPPSVDEVRAYCLERNNSVDPEAFVDFYESKGWKVGSNPMKDWKAAVRTWEKREQAMPSKQSNGIDWSKMY